MTIEFDFSELNQFAANLGQVSTKARRNVHRAVEVTARHVKDDWSEAANRTGLGGYARDIDYDIDAGPNSVEAEVGPTPGDSGSFGFVEDAPGGVKSAPQHAGKDAAAANEQDFIRGLLLAISEPLEDV